MKQKPDIDTTAFMKAVQACKNDVLFVSQEGDRLNLKSALSQFLFIMLQTKPELLHQGDIVCAAEDRKLLHPFLEDASMQESDFC